MVEALNAILEQYEFSTLQAMLSFNGYKSQGRISKLELMRILMDLLLDPARVMGKLAKLSRSEREVLVALQRQSGEASRGAISRRLRDLNLLDARETRLDVNSSQQPEFNHADSRYLDETLAHLLALGLVFGRRAPDPWGRITNLTFRLTLTYVIPPELLKQLPPPPPLATAFEALQPPGQLQESSARVFQRDLYIYWSYVDRNRPELIAKGLLAKRHLTAVNETLLQRETIGTGLGEADFPRLLFLRLMLTQLGLIQTKELVLESRPAEKFFGLEPHERIRRTYEAYIEGRLINEMTLIHSISAYAERLLPVPDRLVNARRAIASCFSLARGWTAFETLIEYLRESNYEFFLPRTYRGDTSDSYYYGAHHPYTASGNPLGWEWQFSPSMDESEGWRRVEGQLIVWQVTRPLYWMGLVDLGVRKTGTAEPDCFQLSAPGRWLLAGGAPPEIPVGGGQVIVQPDFTILAFDPISDGVLYRLEQFSRRVSAERAILFRLSQQSVYAGQQAGWDTPRIQVYLEELSRQPLPANIARTLVEWQASHERIRIYTRVHVLHANPADLDELAADVKTAPLLAGRVSATVVVLPADHKLAVVKKQLVEMGWWPVITPQAAGLPARAVRLDGEGRLTFVQPRPGLYLRAHLARFAEPEGEGYRLTPASIRRAVNAGLSATQVVTELERVLSQPVPHEQSQRLMAWSGFFGQVEAEEMSVLRFKNAAALNQFRRDPQLADLLRPLRSEDLEHLVLVRPKDVEKLRRLLTERGVEWKD